MTGRLGSMSIDGTPISQADVARMEAEEALHADWQRRAVRVVASSAIDASDCRELLSMLGLETPVVLEARKSCAGPVRKSARKPARRRATAA